MFKDNLDDRLASRLHPGPKKEHKVFKEKDMEEAEEQQLSRDPDAGHLEAERLLEEQRLQKILDKKEEEEKAEEREEDRKDLVDTYRRF